MITKNAAYMAAINAPARTILYKAVIDLIDPDIVYGTVSNESVDDYSKDAQVYDKDFSTAKYATLENDRWTLDGTYNIYPDSADDLTQEVGYQSEALSFSDGSFTTAQYVEMQFSGVSILQACSIYFSNNLDDGYAVDFTVDIKVSGTSVYSETFTNNTSTNVSLNGFTVNTPDAIRVTVTKWSKPNRRMRVVEIVPGIYETWTQKSIVSLDITHNTDISNTGLPYGSCTLQIDNASKRFNARTKDGIFKSIEERQPIPISIGVKLEDGTVDWTQVGIYYQYSGGWKTGRNGLTIQWYLVDIIGLLANRAYVVPSTLPTTVDGWISNVVSQLGTNFSGNYVIDDDLVDISATINDANDISNITCGDILRYICQICGAYLKADAQTGYVSVKSPQNNGKSVKLDQMSKFPEIESNPDIAYIQFELFDENKTIYNISGNNTSASTTVTVKNPFIHTQAEAISAAKLILQSYGGNRIKILERGDMSNELGDVDGIQLDKSSAIAARRIKQSFSVTDGVLKNLPAEFIQPDGFFLYNKFETLTGSGTWTAPSGVTEIGIIVVGGGSGGSKGEDGTWDSAGKNGINGLGAKVFSSQISINSEQSFEYICGEGGTNGSSGTASVFGAYSSQSGQVFPYGYMDVNSGKVYGRSGVYNPTNGTGDGGSGGIGGHAGRTHPVTVNFPIVGEVTQDVVDVYPSAGTTGSDGASGCIIVFYAN